MSVLLLTGPPAAGKNTVAEQLARRRPRCAVIDVDVVRHMVIHPQREPWEGEEGPLQQRLGITNACSMARNFTEADYEVIVIDVITDSMLLEYRARLGDLEPWIVQLMPTEQEVTARLLSRPDYLSRGEITWLYDQQAAFEGYDDKLDNSTMTPEAAVDWLLERWPTVLT